MARRRNENWEFDEHGLMRRREASINDLPITADERRIEGPRPVGDTSTIPLRRPPRDAEPEPHR
jgi:uncharacterized protein